MKKIIITTSILLLALAVTLIFKLRTPENRTSGNEIVELKKEAPPVQRDSPEPAFPPGTRGLELLPWGFELVGNREIPAPTFEINDIESNNLALEDYRGEILLLNFWATWCPPCREEIPSMEAMMLKLENKGIRLLAVSSGEAEDTVIRFVEEQNMQLHVALDPDGKWSNAYGINSIPTTFVIDKQGNFLARKQGGMDWNDPELIEALLILAES